MHLHRDRTEAKPKHRVNLREPGHLQKRMRSAILKSTPMRWIGPYLLNNPYILAPMAGVSEMPFRVLAFRMGAALCPTELVSAQGLMRANTRTLRYLRHDPAVERPYSLQVFGGEPEVMAQAARIGQQWGAEISDINML